MLYTGTKRFLIKSEKYYRKHDQKQTHWSIGPMHDGSPLPSSGTRVIIVCLL